MAKTDDWFRNARWNSVEETAFLKRLSRSRSTYSKAQYARIKASYLQDSADPVRVRAAIALLNRTIVEWPVESELACCYWQLANCHLKLGDLDQSIESFRKCFNQERVYPNAGTRAWSDFSRFVAERRLKHLYDEALEIMRSREKSAIFPIDKFFLHAVRAVIAREQGNLEYARREAAEALEQATRSDSGMANHPTLGLVEGQERWITKLNVILGES